MEMEIREQNGAVTFRVRVAPRASRDATEGVYEDADGGALKVRVTSPPVEGEANDAVRRLLARCLNVPPSAVRILAGEQSRTKRVSIAGVTAAQVRNLIEPSPNKGQPKGGNDNARHSKDSGGASRK
ncbi:MAG TPA: DUF167 domain-containing protein [Candidatus Acidoferrales bacterium]|nr:DUF167 domain-containing protein [Candidatus Acidoferrales bacterium]